MGYRLLPSALRAATPPGLGALAKLNGGTGPNREDLRRPSVLDIDGISASNGGPALLPDEELERVEGVLETDLRKQLRALRAEVVRNHKANTKIDEELKKLKEDPRHQQQADFGWRSTLGSRRRELKNDQSDIRGRLGSLREQVLVLRSVFYGERHSLLAFRQRSVGVSYNNSSSWLLLAAMQHHGVPTRLLDWSTSAGIAIYFAVKGFRNAMIEHHGSIANWLEASPKGIEESIFAGLDIPELWILNPYRLARSSTGYNRIDDPSIRTDLDYLFRFHESPSWPYNGPMPATIPWHSERLFAQRGTFTIHGRDTRPLEDQYPVLDSTTLGDSTTSGGANDAVLSRVDLSPGAAIYAVKHIVQYFGLDEFSIFRGEDDLGQSVAEQGRRNKEVQKDQGKRCGEPSVGDAEPCNAADPQQPASPPVAGG